MIGITAIYVHLLELIYVDISPETFTSPYGFTSIGLQAMKEGQGRQWQTCLRQMPPPVKRGFEAVVPNPKLKLMDQLREVMRLEGVEG